MSDYAVRTSPPTPVDLDKNFERIEEKIQRLRSDVSNLAADITGVHLPEGSIAASEQKRHSALIPRTNNSQVQILKALDRLDNDIARLNRLVNPVLDEAETASTKAMAEKLMPRLGAGDGGTRVA